MQRYFLNTQPFWLLFKQYWFYQIMKQFSFFLQWGIYVKKYFFGIKVHRNSAVAPYTRKDCF